MLIHLGSIAQRRATLESLRSKIRIPKHDFPLIPPFFWGGGGLGFPPRFVRSPGRRKMKFNSYVDACRDGGPKVVRDQDTLKRSTLSRSIEDQIQANIKRDLQIALHII